MDEYSVKRFTDILAYWLGVKLSRDIYIRGALHKKKLTDYVLFNDLLHVTVEGFERDFSHTSSLALRPSGRYSLGFSRSSVALQRKRVRL
jgi:hypothetical protein